MNLHPSQPKAAVAEDPLVNYPLVAAFLSNTLSRFRSGAMWVTTFVCDEADVRFFLNQAAVVHVGTLFPFVLPNSEMRPQTA
jgi:hypothetical protein